MTTKTKALSLMTIAAALAAQGQNSQPAASAKAEAPTLSPTEKAIQDIKKPASWISWGADLRLRNEYYNNVRTLRDTINHEQDYFRIRPRLWTSITPIEGLSLNSRITTEPRIYVDPSDSTAFNKGQNLAWNSTKPGYVGGDWTYGIIDQLNLKYSGKVSEDPFSIIVGRQDITLGDGWLVADGTPLDGSWTYYFDAVRAAYEAKEIHTTFEAIGLSQNVKPNSWLPTLNDQNRAVTDSDEKGLILNINNNAIKEANVGAYFMYKGDSRLNNAVSATNPLGTPIGANGDNADIYTPGARLTGQVGENIKYSAEGAYQFGSKADTRLAPALVRKEISAYGANTKASYLFKDSMDNQVGLAYEFLSGDNKGTGKDEMFDVLWGRYPRWTDLYTFVYVPENGRIAQYNNYHRFGPTWTFKPVKKADVSFTYNALWADQSIPSRASAANLPGGANPLFAGGNFRGHYLQTLLRYKFNQHVATLLQGEVLFPGDFYNDNVQTLSFIRAELVFTF